MPGFIVTRGFGPGATPSNLIARGLIPAASVAQVARGLVRRGRRAKQEFGEFLDELKVSIALVSINGKDLVKPIINTVRTAFVDKPTPRIEVRPTRLAVHQPDIKVTVKEVRSKNVKN